ncbi:UNVERIFIED_CONTAM: hypothetical protein DV101_07865 [Bifidobacterium animalis]|uniref:Uncharacterized protein n=1 Tax=Bifidobacterium animalis subsp. lactis CNCM I-2494 TaxID=1042403 RepID=A0A806FV67_BIFAN|nr:hypothetical protein BALAC2494_01192 [Bifidobacterium animalis subsp. lactis CNCM I-2494]AXM93045.1 hypothetical protein CJD49_01510 [Bifidobacterium animalis subsp. lactis]KAB5631898.1 hypothetical protein GBA51_07930 [Bifidobacterium animalis]PIN31525.1 hypothetical protein CUC13_07470 [Bifidobacterium animalis subsp. lactis BB-12]AXQ17566.1 hypothetical protein D0Y52_01465 [Bifidobacterium animalis subsp. lactis]
MRSLRLQSQIGTLAACRIAQFAIAISDWLLCRFLNAWVRPELQTKRSGKRRKWHLSSVVCHGRYRRRQTTTPSTGASIVCSLNKQGAGSSPPIPAQRKRCHAVF